ncbi:putative superfamily I DNA and RNA helicase protein [Rhizobium etli CIAT 652]|uniref:Putative superfamily I DNA and RNA helicase protein n=1 Tax=Rhizobium etli (strain CIAT 652) TaxID=491916 RepID=B3PVN8_RHIE6|nr:putative superfamily I DNA and RNA helicase protein [Rhizobium etli CIAT 652]
MQAGNTHAAESPEQSIFDSNLSVEAKIERARTELLDLSARNRLLNVPRFSKSAKTIDIVDEKSAEIFRVLVTEGKSMTFLAGAKGRDPKDGEDAEDLIELALPDDDDRDESGRLTRHSDTKLQTRMTPNALQKRLLDLYFDARTLEEEQGVNILFLGLGTLKWIDPQNAENIRYAPLVLVPVSLMRGSAAERFKLKARPEDFASNLSLEAFLDRVHKIRMPDFEATDEFSFETYASQVAAAVSVKPDWSVQPDDIVLGFFSFAKFLMYRDLDPTLWPADGKFTERPLITGLVSNGFERGDALLDDDTKIDAHISPQAMTHIVDADSSQAVAIHEVRRGRDLVIQGPPGTGKSQTIANIIAAAVADGKTVLFMAEKMAALEVVKRRLDQANVGDACLELHSSKANKRALLAELQHVWELGAPKGEAAEAHDRRLLETRDSLNAHPDRMHQIYRPYNLTPYQVIGHLTRLRRMGLQPSDIELPAAVGWSPDAKDQIVTILSELAQRIDDIGLPSKHAWHGVGLTGITPLDLERLTKRLANASGDLASLLNSTRDVTDALHWEPADSIASFDEARILAERLATCPPEISSEALANPAWEVSLQQIASVIRDGAEFLRLSERVRAQFNDTAWEAETSPLVTTLRRLPASFSQSGHQTVEQLDALLPRFLNAAGSLKQMLGVNASATLGSIGRLLTIGERVAEAPDASPDAFVAAIWERGLDQASDLAEAVSTYRQIKAELTGKVSDQAWDMDLTAARTAVAIHGQRTLKFLSGDWRRSKALLRTVMSETNPSEMVRLLDLLQKGKAARAAIKDGDGLGRGAFGADWRGEKSDPQPLENLVLWMRSLRGVGAEARQIAGRLTDKGSVATRCEQVRALLEDMRKLMISIWTDLGDGTAQVFQAAAGPDEAVLTQASAVLKEIATADRAIATLMKGVPENNAARIAALEMLVAAQARKRAVENSGELGRAAFDGLWKGADSDWMKLAAVFDWLSRNGDIRILASRVTDRSKIATRAQAAASHGQRFAAEFQDILKFLQVNIAEFFGESEVSQASLRLIGEKLARWIDSDEQLSKYAAYNGRASDAGNLGVGLVVERLQDGRVATADVIPYFEMAFYEAILRHQHSQDPDLARFDGEVHSRLVGEFASLDRNRMRISRLEVVKAHHRNIPAVSGLGPVGILRGEMARRRNHMPIRQLMQKASLAIQALKPVFMMSPLSIAQFLPPGVLEFDLLVMDEASQIQPVDALGAVARAKQVVVVGDERQLPPTKFFSKMTSGTSDDDDDGGAQVSDIESILGLFSARGLPEKMLRWHYRSRHQSLIAVSNTQFYDSKLFIVPSPYTQEAGMGLRFNHIPGGTFEDGVNKVEAKAVAEAIIRHALSSPGLSLGVAAFSIKQRREIQDQLELLRRLNPQTEEFFHSHPHEPFFIKNLENVQGDERDVILISVAYAKGPGGAPMSMRFGPLGAEGGERRLNVLISRAKRRCEVYASITDDDIDLERGKGKGVFAFKLFLHYARTGRLSMSQRTDRQMDSVFEEQIMAALQERGYQVHPQVGIAGFFIDLAVADEAVPGRYLLGIECDGAEYHSSRSARDRDRLRQSVLEDHGWTIHRIWSTDWFQRPKAELDRLVTAIEQAKANALSDDRVAHAATKAVPVEVVTIERADVTEIGLQQVSFESTTPLYEEVSLTPNPTTELHEAPLGILVGLIKQTVEAEGPIHRDEVITRIRTAWGLQRAGNRIDSHVGNAINTAVNAAHVHRSGDFLLWPGAEIRLRDRTAVASPSLRRIEMIPPMEIDQGLTSLIATSLGATENEAVSAVARGLGFKATSSQLRDVIVARIEALKSDGGLSVRDGMLVSGNAMASAQ